MPVRVSIGLGSNLGDRARHIADAVTELAQLGKPVAVSSLYESAPIGGPDQGPYINAVVVIETDHGVREVLDVCMAIEKRHGRERRERWGPRTLDLDILLYGDRSIDEPGLTVPHPHLGERRFVLAPLLEAEPEATLPDGTTVDSLLAGVSCQEVERIGRPGGQRAAVAAVFFLTGAAAVVLWWLLGKLL